MKILKAINLAFSFFLELAMLASFCYWGFLSQNNVWLKWGLGLGMPLIIAILWGFTLAPKANRRLKLREGIILSFGLFCLAALALYLSDYPMLAIFMITISLINRLLVLLWQQW